MTSFRQEEAIAKGDKALVLSEAGLPYAAIAEGLSVKPCNIGGMILRARQRREKAKEAAE